MPLFAALPGIDEKSERFQAIKLREALDEAMPALIWAASPTNSRSTRELRSADLDAIPT